MFSPRYLINRISLFLKSTHRNPCASNQILVIIVDGAFYASHLDNKTKSKNTHITFESELLADLLNFHPGQVTMNRAQRQATRVEMPS